MQEQQLTNEKTQPTTIANKPQTSTTNISKQISKRNHKIMTTNLKRLQNKAYYTNIIIMETISPKSIGCRDIKLAVANPVQKLTTK